MKRLFSKIKSISGKKLQVMSVILFILSGITAYFSRREEMEACLSRVYVPARCGQVYYIWELLGVAVLFFVTALSLLILSFNKPKK